MSDLPRRVRTARSWAHLTQAGLAEAVELSEQTVKRTESGDRVPPRRELLAIAEACEVPMWFLEGGWDNYPGSVDEQARRALDDIDGADRRRRCSRRDLLD